MMAVPIIVPDTSVLLKWVIESDDEEDRDHALALKDAWISGVCRILVPVLWVYEVGNILGMKCPAVAKQLLQAMVDLELEERTPDSCLDEIYRLIAKYKVTFYDAAYHALAIHNGGKFITADSVYVKKTLAAGHIHRLCDWQAPKNH